MTDLNALRSVLSAGFEPHEVHQRKGSGGFMFDYIDDETVMDRLDDALGIGRHSWSFTVVADGCVRGRVDVAWPDGTTSFYEDFGYANNQDGDALKEAVTDSIRRIGRFLGVARDLYRKHDSSGSGGGRVPSSPARQPARPTLVQDDDDPTVGLPLNDEFAPIGGSAPAVIPTDHCPIHNEAWRGNPGDLYHGPKGVVPGGYCRHPDNVKKARGA